MGTIPNADRSDCVLCGAGSYNDATGATSCTQCEAGESTCWEGWYARALLQALCAPVVNVKVAGGVLQSACVEFTSCAS